eukprot:CAMPEP_0185829586 /NCGR_PEP_ID=MMETSP1353-20130828/343_1 /TAXON_ID=1077150 /ORGANISM="Erythrolobus australicus, Strain CCMP3124" /LENGTH=128 /DNA_ID=CAMNT_0028527399 /DNA_START=497 /DNA_END=883 /DNA_ORIENTATION=+
MTRGEALKGGPMSYTYSAVHVVSRTPQMCSHRKQNGVVVANCRSTEELSADDLLNAETFTSALIRNMTRQHADRELVQSVLHTQQWMTQQLQLPERTRHIMRHQIEKTLPIAMLQLRKIAYALRTWTV